MKRQNRARYIIPMFEIGMTFHRFDFKRYWLARQHCPRANRSSYTKRRWERVLLSRVEFAWFLTDDFSNARLSPRDEQPFSKFARLNIGFEYFACCHAEKAVIAVNSSKNWLRSTQLQLIGIKLSAFMQRGGIYKYIYIYLLITSVH